MASHVNHVAIASDQYALSGRFYESLFGMKPSSKPRPARSVVLGDGYVGMNVTVSRRRLCLAGARRSERPQKECDRTTSSNASP